ncbi:MAG: hypothetical protein QF906_02800, partial [Dehalococcoidales bacterium]|nr:hypothetical protein [Dehalococcoidales bacterium]
RGWFVPQVLRSGNHAQITQWRQEQVIRRTLKRRPDLLDRTNLDPAERQLVERLTSSPKKSKLNLDKESIK